MKVYSFGSSQKYEVSYMYAKLIVSCAVVQFTHVWKFRRAHQRRTDTDFSITQWSRHNVGQTYTCAPLQHLG